MWRLEWQEAGSGMKPKEYAELGFSHSQVEYYESVVLDLDTKTQLVETLVL